MLLSKLLSKARFSAIKPLKVSGVGHPNMTTTATMYSHKDQVLVQNPSELMIASMIACENFIIQVVAQKRGIKVKEVLFENVTSSIDINAQFLPNPPAVRFNPISMDVILDADISDADLAKLKEDVHKGCPVYSTLKASGIEINSNWKTKK